MFAGFVCSAERRKDRAPLEYIPVASTDCVGENCLHSLEVVEPCFHIVKIRQRNCLGVSTGINAIIRSGFRQPEQIANFLNRKSQRASALDEAQAVGILAGVIAITPAPLGKRDESDPLIIPYRFNVASALLRKRANCKYLPGQCLPSKNA